jgi:hypothetical protein
MKSGVLYLLLFLGFMSSSCRNEKKEKYLLAVEKTLDRETEWFCGQKSNIVGRVESIYINTGRPVKIKEYYNSVKKHNEDFNRTEDSLRVLYHNDSNIETKINCKRQILEKAISLYTDLQKIDDKVEYLKAKNFDRFGYYFIGSNPEKLILDKNEKFKAKLFYSYYPTERVKDFVVMEVDNRLIKGGENGFYEYTISGDSTMKMKPGNYVLNGKLIWNRIDKDSIIRFTTNHKVIPPVCE